MVTRAFLALSESSVLERMMTLEKRKSRCSPSANGEPMGVAAPVGIASFVGVAAPVGVAASVAAATACRRFVRRPVSPLPHGLPSPSSLRASPPWPAPPPGLVACRFRLHPLVADELRCWSTRVISKAAEVLPIEEAPTLRAATPSSEGIDAAGSGSASSSSLTSWPKLPRATANSFNDLPRCKACISASRKELSSIASAPGPSGAMRNFPPLMPSCPSGG
mmetsp:Transcript_122578/g.261576  ORF Transcript_122578/g.261576 Transcript_122578/m.261576 type:complete len:221 (+) Transcript_122578:405-1067(+)